MSSIFTGRGETPAFRISLRGYDRAEVDEFLRRTAADRQRLQEDLAQLEAFMATSGDERRELERLAAIRREVASCLETSIGALRTATGLLASVTPPNVQPAPPPQVQALATRVTLEHPPMISRVGTIARLRPKLPSWSWPTDTRKRVLVAVGPVAALMLAAFMYQNEPRANEIPAETSAETRAAAAAPAPASTAVPAVQPTTAPPEAASSGLAAREDGLVLTVTARRACWIGSTLDGGQRLERMLVPNETIMLRATNEAVLRIGDATALSILINNQPAKPLGTTGQVVTHRITRANYKNLLEN
jgi:DivIVA domain-containing protein